MMLFKAFLLVTLLTVCMCSVVYYGVFDELQSVESGFHHYAEHWNTTQSSRQFHRSAKRGWLPRWMKMPLNTVVNIGYVIVGAYWCAMTTNSLNDKMIGPVDSFFSYLFNLMAIFYAPIQTIRIITQTHRFGVLDQWYTFPLFAIVAIWIYSVLKEYNRTKAVLVTFASIASYFFTLTCSIAFEICLTVHILLAFFIGIYGKKKYPESESHTGFYMTVLMCCGFVVLKILDLELPKFHLIFHKVSGHFLSKICDFLQIHFVNKFIFAIIFHKNCRLRKKLK